MNSDYKKYSLEQLDNWVNDALTSADATPQEIYDVIKNTVSENYYYFKHQTSRAYELLALLNGNGKAHLSCDKDDSSEECKKSWTSFWEENSPSEEVKKDDCMPPWGHSDMEALRYTDDELNAMCDKAELDSELEKIRKEGGYDWTPESGQKHSEHYYDYTRNDINRPNPFDKDKEKTLSYSEAVNAGWEMTGDGIWIPPQETPKKKWILPIQCSENYDIDNYYVNFPDDLLLAANLKEGDEVEWVDQGDGSYLLRKTTQEDK